MTDSEEVEYRSNSSPFTVVGLHPDYTYLARVAAVTSVGAGPFSSSVQVRLPEDGKLLIAMAMSKLLHFPIQLQVGLQLICQLVL